MWPGGQRCQVNVSPTSSGARSQDVSAQAGVMDEAGSPARRVSTLAAREGFSFVFVLLNLLPDALTPARREINV